MPRFWSPSFLPESQQTRVGESSVARLWNIRRLYRTKPLAAVWRIERSEESFAAVVSLRPGSLRFELDSPANAGLETAFELLSPVKERHPSVSWADLLQMASVSAIEVAGGPRISIRYGRIDVSSAPMCRPSGPLPKSTGPWNCVPEDHLREVVMPSIWRVISLRYFIEWGSLTRRSLFSAVLIILEDLPRRSTIMGNLYSSSFLTNSFA